MNIILIGAGGNGKVCADIAKKMGYTLKGFIDDWKKPQTSFFDLPILGVIKDLESIINQHKIEGFFTTIGDNYTRQAITQSINTRFSFLQNPALIHPTAIYAHSEIGDGCQICAGVIIQPNCNIERGCILNSGAQLDHDSTMGAFSSLAPNAVTGGNVKIGAGCFIAISATILHGKKIGDHSVIGAGSLVTKDIPDHVVAFGSPAKIIRTRLPQDPYF